MEPASTTALAPASPALPPATPASPRRWIASGAALGLAATALPAALITVGVTSEQGIGAGLLFGALISGPAAAVGAMFGRYWRRLVARDADRVTVAGWLARLAGQGAVFASVSAVGTAASTLAVLDPGGPVTKALVGLASVALVAAPAGAITMVAAGLPFLVSLARGRRPWAALTITSVLAPATVVASIFTATHILSWLH